MELKEDTLKVNILMFIMIIIAGATLGLIISKIETKLSWKQLLQIKYESLILVPILKLVDKNIKKVKLKLSKLYKIRSKIRNKIQSL